MQIQTVKQTETKTKLVSTISIKGNYETVVFDRLDFSSEKPKTFGTKKEAIKYHDKKANQIKKRESKNG